MQRFKVIEDPLVVVEEVPEERGSRAPRGEHDHVSGGVDGHAAAHPHVAHYLHGVGLLAVEARHDLVAGVSLAHGRGLLGELHVEPREGDVHPVGEGGRVLARLVVRQGEQGGLGPHGRSLALPKLLLIPRPELFASRDTLLGFHDVQLRNSLSIFG